MAIWQPESVKKAAKTARFFVSKRMITSCYL